MASVLWQTQDSFQNKVIAWRGIGSFLRTKVVPRETAVLIAGRHYPLDSTIRFVTKILVSEEITEDGFPHEDISPVTLSPGIALTHILNEFGSEFQAVAIENTAGFDTVFYSLVPETGAWVTAQEPVSFIVLDLVGPDYPESPRLLIIASGVYEDRVLIIPASEIDTMNGYVTDWSLMASGINVLNDIETVRII